MSDFNGLRVALSALLTQRRGLEITGHNIANAKTEGFSRQRVDAVQVTGPTVPAMFSRYTGSGLGVRAGDVLRARNVFLEARSHAEYGADASLRTRQSALGSLELLFGEPSDIGIQTQLSEFWAGWDDVANSPADSAARSQVVQRAATLADTINKSSTEISNLRKDSIEELKSLIEEVNGMSANIAGLNYSIQNASVAGLEFNDLADQRDLLISKLSALTNVIVRAGENNTVNVFTDGGTLVRGSKSEDLVLDTTGTRVAVRWKKDGYPSAQSAGSLGGLLQNINDVYPRYLRGLDHIATELRDRVNEVHGIYSGGVIPAALQDQSGLGTLDFTYAVNGAAATTVNLNRADWSGPGGATALQASLTAAINNPALTVAVTGGDGDPLRIRVDTTDPNDDVSFGAAGANPGFNVLFANRPMVSSIPATAQDQSATAGTLDFQVRLNSGAWTTVSVTPADWSGAGGAAALQTALNAGLPAGVTARVVGGNGTPMELAFTADNPTDLMEVGEIGTPPAQNAGLGLLMSGVALGTDRIGGREFFQGTDSSNFSVATAIFGNPMLVGASSSQGGPTDGSAALALASLADLPDGPDSSYRSYIVQLGSETQTVNRRVEIQASATESIDAARESEAGVNIDEEMIAMVIYQQAYTAAARFMTTIDEALDTLISRTGLVGR